MNTKGKENNVFVNLSFVQVQPLTHISISGRLFIISPQTLEKEVECNIENGDNTIKSTGL